MIKLNYDMTDATYFSGGVFPKNTISASFLKKLATNPQQHYYELRTGDLFAETPSMRLGTLLHYMFLTPERFNDDVCVVPCTNRNTKIWKTTIAEKSDDRFYCTDTEHQKAMAIYEENKHLKDVFDGCKNEAVAYGDMVIPPVGWDKIDDYALKSSEDRKRKQFYVKGKIDSYKEVEGGLHLIDLKTCADLDKFTFDAWKLKYHMQLAFYGELLTQATGKKVVKHSIVAVETKAPYRSCQFDMSFKNIEAGREEIEAVCAELFDDNGVLLPEPSKQLEVKTMMCKK